MPTKQHWAALREEYLKAAFPDVYRDWKAGGSLAMHLEKVARDAAREWDSQVMQMSPSPDVSEAMEEVIRLIVMREVIFSLPSR